MKRSKWLMLAATIAALTLLAGACGGDDGGGLDQVASLGDTGNDSGSDGDDSDDRPMTEEERQQAHLDFAACMREHGIDMPDPEFTDDGGVMMRQGVAIGGENGPDPSEMEEAHAACEHFIEDVIEERRAQLDPEEEERMKQQALDFAKCMREHGIDMPDPQFDGGRVTQQVEAPADQSKFEEAQKACAGEDGPGFRLGAPPAATSEKSE